MKKTLLILTGLLLFGVVVWFAFKPPGTSLNVAGSSSKWLNSTLLSLLPSYENIGLTQMPLKDRSAHMGTSRDISYGGMRMVRCDLPGQTYCSGLILDIYTRAMEQANAGRPDYLGFPISHFKDFRRQFYGVDGNEQTLVHALTANNLAERIPSLWDAEPGDLVQFWRHNKTGHTVIYMGGEFTDSGQPVSVKYWSIQGTGLGASEEYIFEPAAGKGIDPNRIYIARPYLKPHGST